MEYLLPLLGQYALQSPLLLVWLAGLVLAIVRWQHERRPAILILIVCAISIVDLLIGGYISIVLPMQLAQAGRSAAQIGAVFSIIGAMRSVLLAVLWVMVFFAVFGRRKTDATTAAGEWQHQPDPHTHERQ